MTQQVINPFISKLYKGLKATGNNPEGNDEDEDLGELGEA
jgi:hypothetical protein